MGWFKNLFKKKCECIVKDFNWISKEKAVCKKCGKEFFRKDCEFHGLSFWDSLNPHCKLEAAKKEA